MEARRRSDDYAGNQIRLLLSDLKKASHPIKLKAIKRFRNYIEEYQPEVISCMLVSVFCPCVTHGSIVLLIFIYPYF